MRNFFSAALVLVSMSFAFAQSAAIEGNWGTQQQSNGFTFDVTFSISKNATTLTNVCSGAGTTATAQVTAASTYTDTSFSFLESKEDQKSNGSLNCNVNTQIFTLNYIVQGNSLIFTKPGSPETMVLIRK